MKDETNKLISIEGDVFALRALFLLETDPQSNKYRQILFTQEQYKQLTNLVQTFYPQCKNPEHNHGPQVCFEIPMEKSHETLVYSEIRPYYDKEYIDAP